MCDGQVIKALGPRGHLVNTSRGALVDEDALLAALNSGQLWRASLDVLLHEPPTGSSAELTRHPSVLATPHIGYLSTESAHNLRQRAAARLKELLAVTSGGA
jgi:Phosphoglycerate dehydrogenase and related dehydrogenases